MKLKKWQKIILGGVIILVIMVTGGLAFLKSSTYNPSTAAIVSSEASKEQKDYYLFSAPEESDKNLIFYPGALVEPASYNIWAKEVAAAGYNVYLLKMPFNLAIFGENKAQEIINKAPNETYVLAGHSLGGVMASRFVAKHEQEVVGMIYLASYPDEKGDLAKAKQSVLSISATEDQLVTAKDIANTKKYLPKETQYTVIEGGNHAGFGSYGAQKKDGQATISNQTQQEQISQLIINWLQEKITD
ncbi:alpha/beta family hydrolase [Enterococcus sp. 2201sp1_2201st1_B8_2201SCRN_220225]|uniref:alpha/beta family hydrolase n=1 Tax=unclassified Enterococcus TaxID=2608891 RepID=UPI0034A50160